MCPARCWRAHTPRRAIRPCALRASRRACAARSVRKNGVQALAQTLFLLGSQEEADQGHADGGRAPGCKRSMRSSMVLPGWGPFRLFPEARRRPPGCLTERVRFHARDEGLRALVAARAGALLYAAALLALRQAVWRVKCARGSRRLPARGSCALAAQQGGSRVRGGLRRYG
jgi:hypothetical protein